MRTTVEILRMLPADSEQHRSVIGTLESQVDLLAGQLEILLARPEAFLVTPAGERE